MTAIGVISVLIGIVGAVAGFELMSKAVASDQMEGGSSYRIVPIITGLAFISMAIIGVLLIVLGTST